MARFWVILIIIILICGILFALTYSVPQIKDVAGELSKNKLPFWLVGLLAPILYIFRGLRNWLLNIFPGGSEEQEIKKENERIKKELERINGEIERIDRWRQREIDIQMREIDRLKLSVKELRESASAIESDIDKVTNADLTEGKSTEEVMDSFTKRFNN